MRVSTHDIGVIKPITIVEYSSPRDFIKAAEQGRRLCKDYTRDTGHEEWYGDTFGGFMAGLKGQSTKYTDAAKKLVTQFGNVAIEEIDRMLDQNLVNGVLDYNAAMAGDPMCMFGATMGPTDRSPIDIYIDPWVSANVKLNSIMRRGVAVLALVQALQTYRAVNVYMLKASYHKPASANTVQVLAVPTSPMDLSRASYMLCSPAVNRRGFFPAINAAHNTKKHCGSYPFQHGTWRDESMSQWLADRNGVGDHLFLPNMANDKGFWSNDVDMVAWIKKQLRKYIT